MSIITMHGNKSTAPRGTEIFELLFNRIRLLTNANRGMIFSFSFVRSAREGIFGVDGIRLTRLCTKPIASTSPQWIQDCRTRYVIALVDTNASLISPKCAAIIVVGGLS